MRNFRKLNNCIVGRMVNERLSFCQDFSMVLRSLERFDGKLRGENWQISPLKLANFCLEFAVKLYVVCKSLVFNRLQDWCKNALFCQIFLLILSVLLSI